SMVSIKFYAYFLGFDKYIHLEQKWSEFKLKNITLKLQEAAISKKSGREKDCSYKEDSKTFVAFELDSAREKRPFLLSRDFVFVKPSDSKAEPFQGIVYRVLKSTQVLVEFGDDFHRQYYSACRYDVSFSFNRLCLKRAHQAIEAAAHPSFRKLLFPDYFSRKSIPAPSLFTFCNHTLDANQRAAIRQILSCKGPAPYLVEGPLCAPHKVLSRTGLAIEEAVIQIYQSSAKNRILLCAPFNSTCDVLMRSLKKSIPEPQIFRTNAAFREVDGISSCPAPWKVSVLLVPHFRKYRVILSTFISSFRLHNEGIAAGHFTHIFLIDASSAIEPEVMVPLAHLANEETTVIVSGAPGNRSGWLHSDIARNNGLKVSYFERLQEIEPYKNLDPMFIRQLNDPQRKSHKNTYIFASSSYLHPNFSNLLQLLCHQHLGPQQLLTHLQAASSESSKPSLLSPTHPPLPSKPSPKAAQTPPPAKPSPKAAPSPPLAKPSPKAAPSPPNPLPSKPSSSFLQPTTNPLPSPSSAKASLLPLRSPTSSPKPLPSFITTLRPTLDSGDQQTKASYMSPSSSPKPLPSFKPTLQPTLDSGGQQTKASYMWVEKGAMPIYVIPKDIKELIKKDKIPEILKKPLTPSTYRDYFAALLYAEDFYIEKWSEFELKDITLKLQEAAISKKLGREKDSSYKEDNKTFVAFELDSAREKRPFILSRDFVFVKPSERKAEPFQGIVYRVVKSTQVLVEFGEDFHRQYYSACRYDVSFSFNRVCLKRAHQAIEAASHPSFRKLLFPDYFSRNSIPAPSLFTFCNHTLDANQKAAIRQILSCKGPAPYLVEGPLCVTDGTTRRSPKVLSRTGLAIEEAVIQIYQSSAKNRILLCTPINSTCDVLMRSLKKSIPEPQIFRANAAFREIDGVPIDILASCPIEGECFACPSLQELRKYRVILSTFISSFRLHNEGIAAGHFTHIFLVDASSATEPEVMVPLAHLAIEETNVIVSGAPGNRSGWVRSDIARYNGLRVSYFERLRESVPYKNLDPMFIRQLDDPPPKSDENAYIFASSSYKLFVTGFLRFEDLRDHHSDDAYRDRTSSSRARYAPTYSYRPAPLSLQDESLSKLLQSSSTSSKLLQSSSTPAPPAPRSSTSSNSLSAFSASTTGTYRPPVVSSSRVSSIYTHSASSSSHILPRPASSESSKPSLLSPTYLPSKPSSKPAQTPPPAKPSPKAAPSPPLAKPSPKAAPSPPLAKPSPKAAPSPPNPLPSKPSSSFLKPTTIPLPSPSSAKASLLPLRSPTSSPKPLPSFKPTLRPTLDSGDQQTKASYVWVEKGAMPIYVIPEDIKELIKNDKTPKVLKNPLTPSSYRDYFAALLYAEDFYIEKWSEFKLKNITLKLQEAAISKKSARDRDSSYKEDNKTFVAFELDSARENRPFILSRDFVFVKPSERKAEPFQSTQVLVEFGDDFHRQYYSACRYDVSFSFNRVCLKRAHQAIEAASHPSFRKLLFPDYFSRNSIPAPSLFTFCNHTLDANQRAAIRQILSCKGPAPYLVEGPLCVTDGTTKRSPKVLSRTGLAIEEAVIQIYQSSAKNRILLCTPINSTCDVLMRSLKKSIPEPQIFRANAAFREIDGVPIDILASCPIEGECFACPSLQELRKYRVILSTFISSFRLHNEGVAAGHFTHIFLVDASSATEPEVMVPLAHLANEETNVIVSGAPGNRSGWVRSDIARYNGLRVSYFERLRESVPYKNLDPMFIRQLDDPPHKSDENAYIFASSSYF
ncbi:hypothetical protein Tsubulata_010901, partial [Turnera subulata]